jgi:hypothetical protein
MEIDDIVLVWCYRGYRPGLVKEKGKRKTKVSWANGDTEWIENKRIREPTNLKDRCWMEKSLKDENKKVKNGYKQDYST